MENFADSERTALIVHMRMSVGGDKYFLVSGETLSITSSCCVTVVCFQQVWTPTECPQEVEVPNNNLQPPVLAFVFTYLYSMFYVSSV